MRRFGRALIALAVGAAAIASTSSSGAAPVAGVPVGFAVTPYAFVPGTVSSIAFGPDTRNPSRTRLYVAVYALGQIRVVDDVAGVGFLDPRPFATALGGPLGVVMGEDGTVFASGTEGPRDGPFGHRSYGKVWRLRDTDRDGAADVREVVLRDLPNGKHNTNGLAFGPDGFLYVTNGSSTDDGIDGGPPEVVPWSGAVIRVDPRATNVSVAALRPRRALVATGMRNPYDLAFSPVRPTWLFVPTNGPDDARQGSEQTDDDYEDADDLLYRTDVADRAPRGEPRIDDFGFPSCLYNTERQGDLDPYDSPNPDVIEAFGRCPVATVPRPAWSFGLHVSPDGLAFQSTSRWGAAYRNDLFVADFGGTQGFPPGGHEVERVELDPGGLAVVGVITFMAGVTPLDLTFDDHGDLFVADFTGVILKVASLGA